MNDDSYLIFSVEHTAWWGPGGCLYLKRLSEAGRYTRDQALRICTDAMPGTAARLGALPELPVREDDVQEMISRYRHIVGLEGIL